MVDFNWYETNLALGFELAPLGYVVDFMRFHVRDAFAYPTFNVADCTIAIGAATFG